MMKLFVAMTLTACGLFPAGQSAAQTAPAPPQNEAVSTREMERINWMEFREAVPARVRTVLLPTGTLEPHGVANNGADNTAPTAIARRIAPRVGAMIAPTLPYG
ncbi:MAG: creatininase family protein, partial [Pyrinomonadaceae bacterium]